MKKGEKSHSIMTSGIWGFVLLIPFILLELINRWKFHETFPIALFVFAWVLQSLFIFILKHIFTIIKKEITIVHFMIIMVLIACLVLISYIWGSWIIDQWPCLMGIPHCD